jgi:hypothetical protein
MERELTNNLFNAEVDDSSESRKPENVFIDRPLTSDTEMTQVNGHYLPDEDEDEEEEDDLVLGDEDELDEDDLDEAEIDVEVDEDLDEEDITEDDLVLDADDDEEEEDDL